MPLARYASMLRFVQNRLAKAQVVVKRRCLEQDTRRSSATCFMPSAKLDLEIMAVDSTLIDSKKMATLQSTMATSDAKE